MKVQYPDIDHIIRTDLTASRRVAAIYQRFDSNPMDFLPLLDELQRHLKMELDFRREAQSAERIRGFFAEDPTVRIPEILHEHCTRRVITMEYVEGVKVNDREALEAAGIEYSDLMTRLMRIFNQMILAHGFFHADPHPGNILVNRSPRGKALFTLLDFGLAKELPEGFGLGIFELMFSMMTFNESAMLRAFRELGFETKTGDDATLLMIARRMISRSDTGAFQGEFTEDMTDEMFEAIRENPGREGADRLRAGGARLCAVVGHRAHAGSARQCARCDGAGGRRLIGFGRKCLYRGDAAFEARQQEQVPAVEDLEPRVRDQSRQEPRVDERHDRIVVAGHHERRLSSRCSQSTLVQPGERPQLIQVAERLGGAMRRAWRSVSTSSLRKSPP